MLEEVLTVCLNTLVWLIVGDLIVRLKEKKYIRRQSSLYK